MAEFTETSRGRQTTRTRTASESPAVALKRRAASERWKSASGKVDTDRADIVVADLGGTSIKLGCVRAGCVSDTTATYSTSVMRVNDPTTALVTLLRSWCVLEGLVPSLVVATVPGLLDVDFDTVLQSLNVPELNGRAFASELSAQLDIPVVLERDAVLQLLGECTAGAARGEDSVLGIYLGTGIGAAYLERGTPLRGGGWALELGHRRTRRDGVSTAIGNDRGATESLEDRASGVRLQSIAARMGVNVGSLFEHPGSADDELLGLVDDHALAISDCLAFLSPTLVVVGGGLIEMPGYPWGRLLSTLEAQAPVPEVFDRVRVVRARLGWRAALHGALAECRASIHNTQSPAGVSP